MQGVTLTIAVTLSALVLLLNPIYGLIVYVASFAFYPTYLSVPVGTIDFTLRRIVILAVFAKLFLLSDLPRRFRFIWLDRIIIIYFIAQLVAGAMTATSLGALLENRAGAAFDMVLPYFAVRMIIKDKQQYLVLLKVILIMAVPLAIVGFYQCMTGNNIGGFLMKYYAWGTNRVYAPISRLGFFRANVTFSHSIMFGLFFAMFGPLCAGILRNAKKHGMLCWIGLGLMGIGVFSSMSSGPILAAALSIPFIASYRWRKHWKPVVIVIIVMCGVVEVISNSNLFNVFGRFTMNPVTAWYRTRLIEVALFEGGMSGHWLTGFGFNVDPGWGPMIDGRGHTDLVNQYVLVLAQFGLVGLLPFLTMNVIVVKKLVDAYKASILDADRWLIWCLSAAFLGLAGAFMSVSLFGPPTTIYAMMVGFAGAMPAIVAKQRSLNEMRAEARLSYTSKSILSLEDSCIR